MKQALIILCICACTSINIFAQKLQYNQDVLMEEEITYPYNGDYHEFKSDDLTPIELLMKEANFSEINGSYTETFMLTPNYATEAFDDGIIPVDEIRGSVLYSLFRGDVISYNGLQNEYNTPLKVKRFKETEQYQNLIAFMEQERNNILGNTYYAIRKIDTHEIFDLKSLTFTLNLPWIGPKLALQAHDNHFKCSQFQTPELDEDTAFKIESNDCEIVMFLKFTGETRVQHPNEQSICIPTKICIANKNTGEIYFIYTPSMK